MNQMDVIGAGKSLTLAVIVAFVVCLAVGPVLIKWLRKLKFRQTEREDGPESHLKKQGTPTMGGIMIVLALIITCALLKRGDVEFLWMALLSTVGFGAIGFLDDYIKVSRKRSLGLRAWQKIVAQLLLSVAFGYYCYQSPLIGSTLFIPFYNQSVDIGIWIIPLLAFVMIATTNSTNLTDGLDGLLGSTSLIPAVVYGVIILSIFITGTSPLYVGREMPLEYTENLKGLVVFSGALAGALLGFLRFNSVPARVFMGDTGSFAIGAALVCLTTLTGTVLLLPLMGGVFVVTAVSDILQVGSYKLRKKRIFKMAPLHHHFELCGMPETKIVSLYTIVTVILNALALLILQ